MEQKGYGGGQDGGFMEAEFWGDDDVADKIKFVRKVYAILTSQLVLTGILIGICNSSEGAKQWCQ